MQRSSGTRFFPLFITLVIVIVTVIAVVSIGRAIFFSGSDASKKATQSEASNESALLKTTSDRGVKLTVRGPIVADENFLSYTIAASPSNRTMWVYNGYLDSVRDQRDYANNAQAYAQFVHALDKANMMKGKAASGDVNQDLRGICATGYVYEYAVTLNGRVNQQLWTSTCDGSKGTLDASASQLNNLFQKQIPDYSDLTPFRQSPIDGFRL
jgi:hypothetical protein